MGTRYRWAHTKCKWTWMKVSTGKHISINSAAARTRLTYLARIFPKWWVAVPSIKACAGGSGSTYHWALYWCRWQTIANRELWTVVWYCIVNSSLKCASWSKYSSTTEGWTVRPRARARQTQATLALLSLSVEGRAMWVSLELFGVQDISLKLLPIYISMSYVRLRLWEK